MVQLSDWLIHSKTHNWQMAKRCYEEFGKVLIFQRQTNWAYCSMSIQMSKNNCFEMFSSFCVFPIHYIVGFVLMNENYTHVTHQITYSDQKWCGSHRTNFNLIKNPVSYFFRFPPFRHCMRISFVSSPSIPSIRRCDFISVFVDSLKLYRLMMVMVWLVNSVNEDPWHVEE